MPKLSIVIPIYNEQELFAELLARSSTVMDELEKTRGMFSELILVNDGSRDSTLELMKQASKNDARLISVDLSRNFGHQAAIQAGLEQAVGDAIVVMDGDLQDPPELLPEMVDEWQRGSNIVIAKRRSRAERGIRKFLFNSFYKVLDRLSDFPMEMNAGHFSLIDRRAAEHLIHLKERNRFMPGLRTWVGFRQGMVFYDRDERAAGVPKMTLLKLMKYGFDAIFSFSYKPLRAIWTLGFVVSAFCILYALFLIALRVFQINVVPGFTTPTVAILFIGGVQLISVGILGEYLGRIYDEVKQRPLFIVNEVIRRNADQKTEDA